RSLIKIRNLRKELDSSENIILTLNYALENKDPRSGGHVQRVALYAARLCDQLGMTADEKETVVKGALLHDVGMIGVPDSLLAKLRDQTNAGAFDRELFELFAASMREGSATAPAARHIQISESPAPHVLCVDDIDRNRELLATLLGHEGFHVAQASNGAEAMDVISRDSIDIVLLDLLMPVQNGAETLRLLRADKRYEFLPVIPLTAGGGPLRQEAILAGADDFISYP